jgi:hypothetical protein
MALLKRARMHDPNVREAEFNGNAMVGERDLRRSARNASAGPYGSAL